MKYHNILTDNMINGEGLRTVLWVSGCEHKCKNCFNPQTWDVNSGIDFDNNAKQEIFNTLNQIHISGITLTGGDPFHNHNYEDVYNLVLELKQISNKTIWIYTGYTYDHIINSPKKEILNYIDVLIDGKYVDELKDLNLKYCGSSNQRVIDVQQSLLENKVVLYTK